MPAPKKGETQDQYIQRAIRYMVEKEGLTAQQAAGKAFGMWRNKKKR